jgi:NAD(P)-dependent dehydrogenase (short-subunit alcohol dehydrogenase family)
MSWPAAYDDLAIVVGLGSRPVTLDPSHALLTDRVAIVTGAAVGIGEAIALTYARFGAHVAVCDRDVSNLDATAEQIEAAGRRVVAGELDVRDGDAVRAFAAVVAEELGHVDILVNNAGGGFQSPFLDVNDKGQDALIRENFTSVTNFVRATVPMFPAAGGSIVNITSIEAHRAGPNYAVYTAMKAGVASLTKSLALELGDRLIRVNCIAPDVIPTPGIGGAVPVHTPLPIQGHADDIAGAAVYLGSDLSRFVTGTTVHVDGGNLAAAGWHRAADGSWAG